MRIHFTILHNKVRNGVESLRDQTLLPETVGSPPKFLVVSVLPNHIYSFQYQLHVRTERGGLGSGGRRGGSVLTLGHAGHYVPICKPIGEVRLICANAAL